MTRQPLLTSLPKGTPELQTRFGIARPAPIARDDDAGPRPGCDREP
jgi:hypothetical protein